MPSAEAILASATAIANEWRSVAAGWHAVLAALVTAAFCGWRPTNRVAAYVLSAPLLSVAVAALLWGNPFTAMVFGAVFLSLLAIAHRLPRQPVQFSTPSMMVIGASLVALGCVYPHFLETDHWITYGYAAPLGVLPCPTLSAVMGATLMSGLLRSAAWSMTLATAGVVYGAIGVFVLDVRLDYALLAGAPLLIGGAVRTPDELLSRSPPHIRLDSDDREGVHGFRRSCRYQDFRSAIQRRLLTAGPTIMQDPPPDRRRS